MNKANVTHYSPEYIKQARAFVATLPKVENTNKGFRERLVTTLQQDEFPRAFDIVNCLKSFVESNWGKLPHSVAKLCGGHAAFETAQWMREHRSSPGCPVLHYCWNVMQTDILNTMRKVHGVKVLNHWCDNFLLAGRRTDAVCRMMERNYGLQLVPVEGFCGFKYQRFKPFPEDWAYPMDWEVTLTDEVIRRIESSGKPHNFAQWYLNPLVRRVDPVRIHGAIAWERVSNQLLSAFGQTKEMN